MTADAVKLAPSILAADFARLGEQVAEAERAGADRIHIDVMDGHFVPNLSMGAPIISSLRRATRLPLEAHLMIFNPDFFVEEFVEAGTEFISGPLGGQQRSRAPCNASRRRENVSASPSTRLLRPPSSRKSCRTSTRCWS